ncbi:MAG: hypothetical protein AB7V04_04925 [Desulfomonilaceae bacterium]
MVVYETWNNAIAAYFVSGTPKGSPIFLSLDGEAIHEIASGFLGQQIEDDPVEHFVTAVRRRVISGKNRLRIDGLENNIEGIPGGVGFLGLMVYAAHNMQEEEGIDDGNYFVRLRELLNMPGTGRPDGLPSGKEEPLWLDWNRYLLKSGFQKTAYRGLGSRTFLQYVISQAILRESDKHYLISKFSEARLPSYFDPEQLGYWLSSHHITRKHLSQGLNHYDSSRKWEFYRAAHAVYQSADWSSGEEHERRSNQLKNKNIECGLYRAENLMGESEYYIFPKQPFRTHSGGINPVVRYNQDEYSLSTLRPGFYQPLWEIQPFVETPLEISVNGHARFHKLVFPKRDFWLLVRDPENSYGAWATWKPYVEIGEEFLLLSRKGKIVSALEKFRKDKLIDWNNTDESENWVEFQDCMVLCYDWSEVTVDPLCQPLVNVLTPRSVAAVSFMGGLRDPNSSAWLEGCAPKVKVYGFEKEFELVVKLSEGHEIFRQEIQTQMEITIPGMNDPDVYQIEVMSNDRTVAFRPIRIISWDEIVQSPEPKPVVNTHPLSTAGLALQGPKFHHDEMPPGGF